MDKNTSVGKHIRKAAKPTRFAPNKEPCSSSRISNNTWICKNSACRAVLSMVDTFCKRCSCCICFEFDDNKDPSIWLECSPDCPQDSCGLSCHIACALHRGSVGNGSYFCASCGKVTGILGKWKKLVTIAKDCRRVDKLCYNIFLSFKLLDGTLMFQDLHEYVKRAKTRLETEVGPLNGVSANLARGLVSRLSVAREVHLLCEAAIQKADDLSAAHLSANRDGNEGTSGAKDVEKDSRCNVKNRGQILQLAWVEESGHLNNNSGVDLNEPGDQTVSPGTSNGDKSRTTSHLLDLNISPDLNEDDAPFESTRDAADGSGGFKNWAQHRSNVEMQTLDSEAGVSRKRPANTEAHDSDGERLGNLDECFENFVEVIRALERQGLIKKALRLKLITWFGLRSTKRERSVFNTYIQTFKDDPPSLAAQLEHSFSDIINSK